MGFDIDKNRVEEPKEAFIALTSCCLPNCRKARYKPPIC